MISIIIPIYNEEENINKTYELIESALQKINYELTYKEKLSLIFDIKIIFLTIFRIIQKKDIKHWI